MSKKTTHKNEVSTVAPPETANAKPDHGVIAAPSLSTIVLDKWKLLI
jgi:hypothetical protein